MFLGHFGPQGWLEDHEGSLTDDPSASSDVVDGEYALAKVPGGADLNQACTLDFVSWLYQLVQVIRETARQRKITDLAEASIDSWRRVQSPPPELALKSPPVES